MITRRAHTRGSIARTVLLGALAITVVFGTVELDSIATAGRSSDGEHAVVVSRDTRVNAVVVTAARSRGNVWFASLIAAASIAALAAHILRTDRRAGVRRLEQFSIRLRAPPLLHVAP